MSTRARVSRAPRGQGCGVGKRGGAAVGAATLAAMALAGCGWFGEDFDPHSATAQAARTAAVSDISTRADRLVAGVVEHGRSSLDGCHEGQNNWKVRETYAWDCRVAVAVVIDGAARESGIVASLKSMHERLVAEGCSARSPRGGLVGMPTDYWETYHDRPGYGPDDLPSESYDCPGEVQVEVASTTPTSDRADADLAATIGGGFWPQQVLTKTPLPDDAFTAAGSSRAAQLYVVHVSKPYYRIEH